MKQDWMWGVVMSILLLMLLSLWLILMEQEYCVYDDMPYLSSYIGKLATEGRWINYLIFHATKHINHTVAQYFNVLCLSCFCCCVARKYCSLRYSIIVTLFSLLSLSFWYVSECPVTTMTMYLFTAIAAFVHDKMDKRIFFLIFGILYGGVVPPMYFLLPLLFLKESNRELIKMLVYWILGYVVGFGFAELATYIRCGHLIQLHETRNPNYITDYHDLWSNIQKGGYMFIEHARLMNWPAIACIVVGIVVHTWNYRNDILRGTLLAIVFSLVILSSYALSITAGIDIPIRTSWGLYLGSAFCIALPLKKNKRAQLAIILLAAGSFFLSSFYIVKERVEAKNIAKIFFESLKIYPPQVQEVVLLCHDWDAWSQRIQSAEPLTLKEPLYAAGFEKVYHTGEKYLEEKGVEIDKVRYRKAIGYYYAICKDILILRIDKDFFSNNHYLPPSEQ